MEYGYFDDAQREYVITNPKTPVKWINYIGTLAFGGYVDHTGGAVICKGDPSLNRITRYIPQLPASDFKGETLYVRLIRAGQTQVFSPYYVPTLTRYELFECRVGLGYSRWIWESMGLRVQVTAFIPEDAACELRDILVTNLLETSVEIDLIPVVEYTHPDALKQFTNADWVPQTMQSRVQRDPGGHLILIQYPFMLRDLSINYFTSSLPASSFETDRQRFLGDHEYGSWRNPLALERTELSNYEANRGDNIAALLHHIGKLGGGETRRLVTILGQERNLETARLTIERYRDTDMVDTALHNLGEFWQSYLSTLQVETPELTMNSMLNIHNPKQCFTTFNWSRYLSLYQLGLGGSRGIGVRDSSQDVMAIIAALPSQAKSLLLKLLSVQKRDGSALHQFNPLTMIGSEGDSLEREDRPHYYSDDHLWIILAVCEYMKETGEMDFLQEVVPYYEKDRLGQPLESGSVLNHLHRALAFTRQDTGQHGLPLLGFADWNDTVNLAKGAESLFTAHLYGKALLEMIELCRATGGEPSTVSYHQDYKAMGERVNQHAWDGEWYLRYFDADGSPLGSQANTSGKIYLNGQSWAVISGFAPPERAIQAMDSARERLNTANGLKLSTPGFNGFDPRRGGITTYPPGAKENGGIFLHTNPWAMIAETILGRGELAYAYYHQINPAAKNERIDEYECEPYVYSQNILADEHPQFGLARNSWLSGTAAWAYRASTQYMLGIRPTWQGLLIDPCIPPVWKSYTVSRRFRGATYNIQVRNPHGLSKGIINLVVDGNPIPGSHLPTFSDGQVHIVEATLEEVRTKT